MNWLVTGGCGFIGTRVVQSLVGEDDQAVRVLDNLAVGTREDLEEVADVEPAAARALAPDSWHASGTVEFVEGDVLDEEVVPAATAGADVVVHLAAQSGVAPSVEDPRTDCRVNVLGTLNCLDASRQGSVSRFVFASSGAAVGEVEPPLHEDLLARPVSPYGASKLAGETYCGCYHATWGLETVALRFSNVYGPGSAHKNSIVAKFFRRALQGKTLEIYGDGGQTRDFIYVGDLVDAVRRAATASDVGGERFQIATNRETSVIEITELILDALAEAGLEDVDVQHTDPRTGDVRENYADISKARELLGWGPSMELEDGLRETLEWFMERERATSADRS